MWKAQMLKERLNWEFAEKQRRREANKRKTDERAAAVIRRTSERERENKKILERRQKMRRKQCFMQKRGLPAVTRSCSARKLQMSPMLRKSEIV